jgi:hypothetical protein
MQGKAIVAGLGKYLKQLVKLLILPWLLHSLFQVAKRHQDTDSRAPAKFMISVIIGLALFGVVTYKTVEFHGEQIDGMYANLDSRLSAITGATSYEEAVKTSDAEGQAEFAEGHQFYLVLKPFVDNREDVEARAFLGTSDSYGDSGLHAYDRKDEGVSDLQQFMVIFVYPGLVGMLFAPILFNIGRTLNAAWVPSESVGFKPYPANSGSLFLVLGAFGIPAALFAAWAFMDVEARSAEGQINL